MNPLLPKKLGEVHAFARIGLELLERGGSAAQTAFGGADAMTQLTDQFRLQQETVKDIADPVKTEKTTQKLRSMMEQYIGDEWDNPVELLEWSGFFFGAGAIHWAIVSGLLSQDAGNQSELTDFADAQTEQFTSWLKNGYEQIKHQVA